MAHWTFLWLALLAPPDATEPSDVDVSSDAPDSEPVEPVEEPRTEPQTEPQTEPPPAEEPTAEVVPPPEPTEPGFFNAETSGEASSVPPPMPEVEELPSKGPMPPEEKPRRKIFDLGISDPDRPPAGSDGGSFFDPGKISDVGPSGGAVQIRGFVSANFYVAQRSNTFARDEDGNFEQLKTLPYFDLGSAGLFIGAPIYADVIYARIGMEFIKAGAVNPSGVAPDINGQTRRFLAFETGALEINPFALASSTPRWFREGFKITAGIFIVPFGLEDEEHAAPANWFVTRPLSMTNNRVYPGTWSDVGATLKWKPTFGDAAPIRPIEVDVGVINGDACSQTRFNATLFGNPTLVPSCERVLRDGEVADMGIRQTSTQRINAPGGFVLPDNNQSKSVVARVQVFPIGSINLGGSFVWGKHPAGDISPGPGESSADFRQAPSWRLGTHLELNFEEMFESKFPLPMIRGEFVMGRDDAVKRAAPTLTDRSMRGGYVQFAQALFRRKKTRLPGLIVQYRFDQSDPDTAVPGVVRGVDADGNPADIDLISDFGTNRVESVFQSHTVGLRLPVLPRFTLKTEYSFVREDGGARNQLANDIYSLEVVADF